MLLHQAVQHGLLGAVARVVDRGAIAMRPAGLGGVGSHALGTGSLGWCSFSRRVLQSIRHRGTSIPSATAVIFQRRFLAPGAPPPTVP